MIDITKNIILIRKELGLTQEELAESLGVQPATYSRIESGKIQISFNRLTEIASCFNISIVDLITYPKKFVDSENMPKEQIKASLLIELNQDKKEQVLKLVFGKNSLEILNK